MENKGILYEKSFYRVMLGGEEMLGSTVSAIGGLRNAIDRAFDFGYSCTQIYTANSRRWNVPYMDSRYAQIISEYAGSKDIVLVAHVPFLVNLTSQDTLLREKSVNRLIFEINNADKLGITGLILHPGSFSGKAREEGIEHIIKGLDSALKLCRATNVTVLLETMSGQGNQIGSRFDELAHIIANSKYPDMLGVCFDTAHVLASGYDISTVLGYRKVMATFDELIGIEKISCFHINNTKVPCGNKTDRHSSIFDGLIDLSVFMELSSSLRFMGIPKILEPPANDATGNLQIQHLVEIIARDYNAS